MHLTKLSFSQNFTQLWILLGKFCLPIIMATVNEWPKKCLIYTRWALYALIKSSAAVAYQHLTNCVFRDALLHTNVIMCGYLHYCHLPVSFDQSGPSPLISLTNKTFLPTELLLTGCLLFFLFFSPFSANSRDCCVWNRSFWNIQTTLSGTNIHHSRSK